MPRNRFFLASTRNKKFAVSHLVYIIFALVMASLNMSWTVIHINWYGWRWLASLLMSIVELVRIYQASWCPLMPGEVRLSQGVCQMTDISVPEIEDIPVKVKEPVS